MSQFICPDCQGEYNTAEDHLCMVIGEWVSAPDRVENASDLATDRRENINLLRGYKP